ncbi:MAG TPA: ATP-binding protein, partial [Hyphomonas sp.]|nr:ATP-binding protein [Hyphomonas sp.]
MQPLFEAVSNSIHSTQARFGDDVSEKGRVTVTVNTSRNKNEVWATVEDNGNGLNEKNWDAFTTTDTDNKIEIGGKGVGRLMWLDCFESIRVKSTYTNDGSALRRKSFDFVLALDNQIRNLSDEAIGEEVDVGFFVRFTGLRNNAYRDKFPGRDSFIFQHFTSHFLPSFIGGRSPRIQVIVGSESRDYPDAISEIVHRQDDAIDLDTAEYGVLTLTLMECSKVASSDLKGKHFVHFIAHDRTVHSQCIDGKLGLNYFGENSDRVFHAIVTGQFLDS